MYFDHRQNYRLIEGNLKITLSFVKMKKKTWQRNERMEKENSVIIYTSIV